MGEELLKKLEELAKDQQKVSDALLEKLYTITERLIQILKDHSLTDDLSRFDFKGFGFRRHGSRLGRFIHFCALDDEYSRILPSTSCNIGDSFYYHGDFNYLTEYMTRDEVLNLCAVLPEFIENMIAKIQDLTEEEQKFLEKYSK